MGPTYHTRGSPWKNPDLTKKRSRFRRKVPKVDILKIDVDSYDCALMQAILAKARKHRIPPNSHGKFGKKSSILKCRRFEKGIYVSSQEGISRWWFQICFVCSSRKLGKISILTHIFDMG